MQKKIRIDKKKKYEWLFFKNLFLNLVFELKIDSETIDFTGITSFFLTLDSTQNILLKEILFYKQLIINIFNHLIKILPYEQSTIN